MDIFGLLHETFSKLVKENDFSFAKHTTIGCGGTADACIYPQSERELVRLLVFLQKRGVPYCFLGAGANVLPQDGRFEGVVIRFSRMNRLAASENLICADAGVTGGNLLHFAQAHAIGGLEFLTGIPMTVGGATVMNAGVKEGHLSDIVVRVRGVENGKIRVFSLAECQFDEKMSIFQRGIAVTSVLFRGHQSSRQEISARVQMFRERRKKLPAGKSFGCTFVNPKGISAGELIEKCGLKGCTFGGAHVSKAHANFIINEGVCSSDVAALIKYIKEEVHRQTGILLREEVRMIP